MKSQIVFKIFSGVVLGLIFISPVFAQTPTNSDPSNTLVFDNRPHTIPANIALWYAFGYAGDRSPITITLFNAANTGLGFDVFTPEQVRRLRSEDKPLGRGTPGNGTDLTWVGSSPTRGAYIVRVVNSANKSQVFNMMITGSGVETGPPLEAPPFTIGPFSGTFIAPTNTRSESALPVRDAPQVIPANSALWYRFEYTEAHAPIFIALPTGVNSGIYLRIFSASQVKNFAQDFAFIGEGNAPPAPCSVANCAPNDLVWENVLAEPGTYYAEVLNSNTTSMLFRLVVRGKGILPAQ